MNSGWPTSGSNSVPESFVRSAPSRQGSIPLGRSLGKGQSVRPIRQRSGLTSSATSNRLCRGAVGRGPSTVRGGPTAMTLISEPLPFLSHPLRAGDDVVVPARDFTRRADRQRDPVGGLRRTQSDQSLERLRENLVGVGEG